MKPLKAYAIILMYQDGNEKLYLQEGKPCVYLREQDAEQDVSEADGYLSMLLKKDVQARKVPVYIVPEDEYERFLELVKQPGSEE